MPEGRVDLLLDLATVQQSVLRIPDRPASPLDPVDVPGGSLSAPATRQTDADLGRSSEMPRDGNEVVAKKSPARRRGQMGREGIEPSTLD
jgi:hypothetical protein